MANLTPTAVSKSSNFVTGPSGDKTKEVLSDLLNNRTEIYSNLTSIADEFYGATPPANPNVGRKWRCSTTAGLYVANTTYRWNGSAWAIDIAETVNVPQRNCVLEGPVNSSGATILFSAGTGLTVDLKATVRLSFANGFTDEGGASDYFESITSDDAAFWSALPINSTVQLYIDRDSGGTVTGGYSTLAPVYQSYAPTHSAGLNWFDTNTQKMFVSNGSTWTQVWRVFVGTATTNASSVTAVSVNGYVIVNSLSTNSLSTNSLSTNSLSTNSLSTNDIITKGPWVDVRAFGAVGDGVTDDTVAILDALNLLKDSSGGTLYFPVGEFVFSGVRIGDFAGISNPGNIPIISDLSNITVLGAERNKSIIKLKPGTNTDLFVFRFSSGITFDNITLDGNKSQQTGSGNSYYIVQSCGLLVRDSSDIVVENCKVINCRDFGANIASDTQTVTFRNNYVADCDIGIDMAAQYTVIAENIFKNCTTIGIYLEGNNVDINYETLSAINAFAKIIDNTIINCKSGIFVRHGTYSICIDGNSVTGSSTFGIAVDGSSLTAPRLIENVIITNNFIVLNTGTGLNLNTIYNCEVTNNLISRNAYGASVLNTTRFNIALNTISENGNYGIQLINCQNGSISNGNKILNNNQLLQSGLTTTMGILVNGAANDKISIKNNTLIGDTQASKTQAYGVILNNNPTNIYIDSNVFNGNTVKAFVDKSGSATYSYYDNVSDDATIVLSKIIKELRIGNNLHTFGTAAPTTKTWLLGDVVYNTNPTAGGFAGWVCIVAGTPGTWKGFGLIQA